MKKYARIDAGRVVELFETDGDISEMFHPDLVWVDVEGLDPEPKESWLAKKTGGVWTFTTPSQAAPTPEFLTSIAIARRDQLLSEADEATAGMSDAFVAGILDEKDAVMFKKYAEYKLALSKISQQSEFPANIVWPEIHL